jgi:tetratricopeptide (TPR) repeat protein
LPYIFFIGKFFFFLLPIYLPQLGVVFLELNKPAQALAYLDKALEYDPDHEQALLNSAILLQELNKPELRKISRERLLKLLQKDGKGKFLDFFFFFFKTKTQGIFNPPF